MINLNNYTKAQLVAMIETREKEIETLQEEVRKYEKVKAYDDVTDEIKGVYDKLLDRGFNKGDALELTKTMIESGTIRVMPRNPHVSYRR